MGVRRGKYFDTKHIQSDLLKSQDPYDLTMVFLTLMNAGRRKTRLWANPFTTAIPDNTDNRWKRRKVLMCTQHLAYRQRNCYRLAINKMTKFLQYETRDRRANERDLQDLHRLRIEGAATELNYDSWHMREALTSRTQGHMCISMTKSLPTLRSGSLGRFERSWPLYPTKKCSPRRRADLGTESAVLAPR